MKASAALWADAGCPAPSKATEPGSAGRRVHWDTIPLPPEGTGIVVGIQIACGLDWTHGHDISTDPADVTCLRCKRSLKGKLQMQAKRL